MRSPFPTVMLAATSLVPVPWLVGACVLGHRGDPRAGARGASLSAARILLITSRSCVRAGLPQRIGQEAGLEFAVFGEVQRESPLPSVEAARGLALASEADLLIGLGGGSAIVTTRAVAILLRKSGHAVRNVLVPTTPTTAMSCSGAAVLDLVEHVRVEHYDPGARPAAVILEAGVLQTAPSALFRSTAAAAFCSAVELLTVPALHPLACSDAQAARHARSPAAALNRARAACSHCRKLHDQLLRNSCIAAAIAARGPAERARGRVVSDQAADR